jgi:hypothetical protein
MITIITEDKQYNVPNNFDELKCKHYIKLVELEQDKDNYELFPVFYTQRFLEILCDLEEGGLDELPFESLAELDQEIKEGLDHNKFILNNY